MKKKIIIYGSDVLQNIKRKFRFLIFNKSDNLTNKKKKLKITRKKNVKNTFDYYRNYIEKMFFFFLCKLKEFNLMNGNISYCIGRKRCGKTLKLTTSDLKYKFEGDGVRFRHIHFSRVPAAAAAAADRCCIHRASWTANSRMYTHRGEMRPNPQWVDDETRPIRKKKIPSKCKRRRIRIRLKCRFVRCGDHPFSLTLLYVFR